jgi:hypothetical protein
MVSHCERPHSCSDPSTRSGGRLLPRWQTGILFGSKHLKDKKIVLVFSVLIKRMVSFDGMEWNGISHNKFKQEYCF